jgi:hypothetical protein
MRSEPSSQHFSKPPHAPPRLAMTSRTPRVLTRGSAQSSQRPLTSTKEK